MTQQNPSLPSQQVIAPPRPTHATDRYDGPTELYRMYDADDQLLYIGVTCNKAARWHSHRRNSAWWKLVARKELTTYPDRSAALTAELAAIQAEKPLHNIANHPSKPTRHVHLVLTEERAVKLRALAKHRRRGNSDLMYDLLDAAPLPGGSAAEPSATADTLPQAVAELIGAIAAALDVPLADQPGDDPNASALMRQRANEARIIAASVLRDLNPRNIEGAAEQLRGWTAEAPVTYRSWQQRTEQAAAEEQALLTEDGEGQ
jgi:hypothetical protein